MFELKLQGPAKNALGTEMMSTIRGGIEQAGGKPILLTGHGDAFSAGLNLKEVASLDEGGMARFLRQLEEVMAALFHYPGPTVACINGHAIAGGCILALCCDLRVATDHPGARIGVNEVALGLRFPPGILSIVQHRVPQQHLTELILGGKLYSPAGALRVGLVDEVSPDPEMLAGEWLALLASHPAEGYAVNKADLRGGVGYTEAELNRFLEESLPMWTAPALKQRILAVLKR